MKIINVSETAKLLKQKRIELGYSVRDVQNIFNLSHMAVYKWEKGMTLPSIDHMLGLSELYNTSIDSLIVSEDM